MENYFEIEICGLKRQLPLKAISRHTKIATLNILGDVELVEKAATELSNQLDSIKFDCFVGPEVKVLPLIHELSKKMKLDRYVICRKNIPFYMVSPIILKPLPYFPKHIEQLVVDGTDSQFLKGKKVIVVDDVVSTGVTMRMISKMMEKVGAEIVAYMSIIRQGNNQFDKLENFFYLKELPIFKENSDDNLRLDDQ
jgi:adenine phosphoribosyltransferase